MGNYVLKFGSTGQSTTALFDLYAKTFSSWNNHNLIQLNIYYRGNEGITLVWRFGESSSEKEIIERYRKMEYMSQIYPNDMD